MTLFWHPTGPMIAYSAGMLKVSDLNPEGEIKWVMSRMEMLALGLRCLKAALAAQ